MPGIDDFDRDRIRFVPPERDMVVDSARSGVVIVDEEGKEIEPVDPSLVDLEGRMNAPAHLVDEGEAELAEEPRSEVEDAASSNPAAAGFEPSSENPVPAGFSETSAAADLSDEPETVEALPGETERPVDHVTALADEARAQNGAEHVIEATTAVVHQGGDGDPVDYVQDDPEDARRLAPLARRCVEITRDGRRCRSYALRGATMCAGHAGLGLAQDPHAASTLAGQRRTEMKQRRMLVGANGKASPRALLRLAVLEKGEALAARIVGAALDPDGGSAGANLALRTLDAVDPLVTVEATTTWDTVFERMKAGEEPTLRELRAALRPEGSPPGVGESAPEAEELPAQTG